MQITLISFTRDILAYGLRLLSSRLRLDGHNVRMVFFTHRNDVALSPPVFERFVNLVKESDLIGMSVMTNQFHLAMQVTERLKQDLNCPVVWGGVHAGIRPEECLNYAEAVCIGEGEESFPEYVKRIVQGKQHLNVQGMWFKEGGKIVRNPPRPLIQDLDAIPFPDYSCKDDYIWLNGSFCRLDQTLFQEYYGDAYWTLATRGCPFGCSFCANSTLNKRYAGQKILRKRSIQNVISELVEIKERFPALAHIRFEDDAFFSYTIEELDEFADLYRKFVALPLCVTGLNPLYYKRQKLDLLVSAGLKVVRIGIQSASQRTRALFRRRETDNMVIQLTKDISSHKLWVHYDVILDNPWETDEDLVATLLFVSRLPTPYFLLLYSLTLFPETTLHTRAKLEGRITDDFNEVYGKSYFGLDNTYLNKLFILIGISAAFHIRFPMKVMPLLANPILRKIGISAIGYYGCLAALSVKLFGVLSRVHGVKEGFNRLKTILNIKSQNGRLSLPLYNFSPTDDGDEPEKLGYGAFFHSYSRYWPEGLLTPLVDPVFKSKDDKI
ncbi:MAG: B12-binding domain-containing radical SAM protein [Proteobacteria bacterium]|nr:B12-binding domain-containing radical SAM protein [Pseudomonadota bacterium]